LAVPIITTVNRHCRISVRSRSIQIELSLQNLISINFNGGQILMNLNSQRQIKRFIGSYIFFRISTWRSLRSYSCLIFFFSASTNCSFSILNSCRRKSTIRFESMNVERKRRKHGEINIYFFGGNRDLVCFFFCFLADEPHHLLDLLRDICVVHFRRDTANFL